MAMTKPTADFAGTDFLTLTSELVAPKRLFALGIVIEAKGPALARVGAKAIFDGESKVMCGRVGGGCAESTIAHAAIEELESEIPQVVDVDLDDELLSSGMPCGGSMRVYVEPVIPPLWSRSSPNSTDCRELDHPSDRNEFGQTSQQIGPCAARLHFRATNEEAWVQ